MLSALDTSLGKIPDSRFWKIGTRPATSGHPFAEALRSADYAQVHAARADDPPFHKKTWARACPSLPYFPGFGGEGAARGGEGDSGARSCSRASGRCGSIWGCPDTLERVLVEAETWERVEGTAPATGRVVWGVDLGATAASSAVAAYWPESGRLEALAAFPGAMTLAARGMRGRRGHALPGNSTSAASCSYTTGTP